MRAVQAAPASGDRTPLQEMRKAFKRRRDGVLSGLRAEKTSLHQRKSGPGI